jgi:ribonuclease Z
VARVLTLGTAAAVPDETHASTHLAVEGEHGFFLVDCGASPILPMRRAGLALERLCRLIITHFHPDHVGGLPLLLMDTWLLGRADPLPVYGLSDAIERYNAMMDLFRRDEWPGFFTTPCHTIPEEVGALVFEDEDFRVTGAPVEHVVPTMGVRIESKHGGGVVAYSSDTSPCDAVVALARGADILIHEAAGATPGHSGAAQAGEVARRAGAGRLVLVHYRPAPHKYVRWIEEATETFGGPVELGQDLREYQF